MIRLKDIRVDAIAAVFAILCAIRIISECANQSLLAYTHGKLLNRTLNAAVPSDRIRTREYFRTDESEWKLMGNIDLKTRGWDAFLTASPTVQITGRGSETHGAGEAWLEFPVKNGNVYFSGRVHINGEVGPSYLFVHTEGTGVALDVPVIQLTDSCQGREGEWTAFRIPVCLPLNHKHNYMVVSLQGAMDVYLSDLKIESVGERRIITHRQSGL